MAPIIGSHLHVWFGWQAKVLGGARIEASPPRAAWGSTRCPCDEVVLLDFRVRDEFVAPELSTDGTAFSLNSLFQRISFAAHSMSTAEADVQARLHALIDPNTGRDLVSAKAVRKMQLDGSNVSIDLQLAIPRRDSTKR